MILLNYIYFSALDWFNKSIGDLLNESEADLRQLAHLEQFPSFPRKQTCPLNWLEGTADMPIELSADISVAIIFNYSLTRKASNRKGGILSFQELVPTSSVMDG